MRIALKMATGAGKTTVMAMLIAWQTVNAVRHPGSQQFSRGFPGRRRPASRSRIGCASFCPNDPDNYYRTRELLPPDMLGDIERAKIVITNFHAFKLPRAHRGVENRTRAAAGARPRAANPRDRRPDAPAASCRDLMGLKNIVVLNDEAHHCYREQAPG